MTERKIYNKLVRDRIPEIIRAEGRMCGIEVMCDEDYIRALRDKLIEETQEVAEAQDSNLIQELADLYEVIDALMLTQGIKREQILTMQQKRQSNGVASPRRYACCGRSRVGKSP